MPARERTRIKLGTIKIPSRRYGGASATLTPGPRSLTPDSRSPGLPHPAKLLRLIEVKVREQATAELGHEVLDRPRPVIEGWDDGEDVGAGLLGAQHVLEVNAAERRVADGQNQSAAFLQAYVCGALDQRGGNTIRDLGKARRAARDHDH